MSTKKSDKQLEEMLAVASDMVPVNSPWRHYKGNDYRVDCIAFDEETLDFEVVYHPISKPNIHFSRPLSMWLETVSWNGSTLPRYEHLLSLD